MADSSVPGLNVQGARRGGFATDRGERALWSAVVAQAVEDLMLTGLHSLEFAAAVSFFVSGGEWLQSRREIADMLDLHPDDLERLGRKQLLTRVKANNLSIADIPGLGPKAPPVPRPRDKPRPRREKPIALPHLEATFLPPQKPDLRTGSWQQRHGRNPFKFDPYRQLKSVQG